MVPRFNPRMELGASRMTNGVLHCNYAKCQSSYERPPCSEVLSCCDSALSADTRKRGKSRILLNYHQLDHRFVGQRLDLPTYEL